MALFRLFELLVLKLGQRETPLLIPAYFLTLFAGPYSMLKTVYDSVIEARELLR